MKPEEIKLICEKDYENDVWVVWHPRMTGMIVQVKYLNEAPMAIAKSFAALLDIGFKKGYHEIRY